jgi:hypothetical protein
MMERSTFVHTALATLRTLTVIPVPAADADMQARAPVPFSSFDSGGNGQLSQEEFDRVHTERQQQRSRSEKQDVYMGNTPAFGDIDSNANNGLSRDELQINKQRQRALHQQQYQQKQLYQKRMNMSGPDGTGTGQDGGRI